MLSRTYKAPFRLVLPTFVVRILTVLAHHIYNWLEGIDYTSWTNKLQCKTSMHAWEELAQSACIYMKLTEQGIAVSVRRNICTCCSATSHTNAEPQPQPPQGTYPGLWEPVSSTQQHSALTPSAHMLHLFLLRSELLLLLPHSNCACQLSLSGS